MSQRLLGLTLVELLSNLQSSTAGEIQEKWSIKTNIWMREVIS